MTVYTSIYPVAQSATYVKATSSFGADYAPFKATDPTKSLTGTYVDNQWISQNGVNTNQRFHIDLGSGYTIQKIYLENGHFVGGETDSGVQNYTFWGSNTASSFAELTYATDTGWTQLTTSSSYWAAHAGSDASDPQYITVTNTSSYRYYAFKFADNYGKSAYMAVRRVVLMEGISYLELDSPPKMHSFEKTNRKVSSESYTYNYTGITYNSAIMYGGLYDLEGNSPSGVYRIKEVVPELVVKDYKPLIIK